MNTKLYVGNLAYDVTDEDLRGFFSDVGEVKDAKVVLDRFTGRSRGFGFVEMATEEEADKAVSDLNEQPFHNRNLRVDKARGDRERGGNRGGGNRGGPRRDHGGRGAPRGRRDDWG